MLRQNCALAGARSSWQLSYAIVLSLGTNQTTCNITHFFSWCVVNMLFAGLLIGQEYRFCFTCHVFPCAHPASKRSLINFLTTNYSLSLFASPAKQNNKYVLSNFAAVLLLPLELLSQIFYECSWKLTSAAWLCVEFLTTVSHSLSISLIAVSAQYQRTFSSPVRNT